MTKAAIVMVIALTASSSCLAAPSFYDGDTLKRPSPINPAIPMDPKPPETVTVITDPKELAKFKREIGNESSEHSITGPTTVQPDKQSTDDDRQNSEHRTPITSTAPNQVRNRQKRAESDGSATQPLINRDQHKQPVQHKQINEASVSAAPQILPAPIPSPEHQTQSAQTKHEKAQHSPIYFDAQKYSEMKRDIPVPLVPKHHHIDESSQEETKHDDSLTNTNSKNDHRSTTASTISSSTTNSAIHH